MLTLREVLADAESRKIAVGHFNAPNIEIIRAVINAAFKLNVPVVVGFAESERDFFGVRQAVAYVQSVRKETGHPVFSNADHTYSLERVKEAIDAGFDAVIYDGADKSYEENRDVTKAAVAYARASGRNVLVEAELGFIGKGSTLIEAPPPGAVVTEAHMTKPEEAAQFVRETGIDLFAPAVGNVHGMVKSGEPRLSPERVRDIKQAVGVPLVLHGASGNTDEDIRAVITAGIAHVHVSTELRVAYHHAVQQTLAEHPDELAPYRLMQPVVEAVQNVVEDKLKLFSGIR